MNKQIQSSKKEIFFENYESLKFENSELTKEVDAKGNHINESLRSLPH